MTTSKSRVSGPPPAVVAEAKREALHRLAETALDRYRAAAVGGVELSNEGGEDILLGRDGSKWRHGWIPLNPIAAAIKAKKWKGHGGHAPPVGTPRRPSKTRLRVEQLPSGPGRTKAPRPTMSNPEAKSHEGLATASLVEQARRNHENLGPQRPAGLKPGDAASGNLPGRGKVEGTYIGLDNQGKPRIQHSEGIGTVTHAAPKGAAKITKPDPLSTFPGGDKAAWLEGLSRTDLDNLAWNHQTRPGKPGNPEWDKAIGDEFNWRNRGGRPARDPFTGKTRMQDLKEGGRRRLDTGTARISARHRRETRVADRARAAEIAAEHARSTPAGRSRLRVNQGSYRGESGHHITGTDTKGRRVKVFAPGDRAEADTVKANLSAGKDPFAHHAAPKAPDGGSGDLGRMAAVRSEIVKEFAKEHGSDYKLQPPVRDGMSRLEVIDQIRRNNPDVAGLDTVDVERANGRLPGWYVNLPAQKRKEFHPDASSMDKAKLGVAESAKRARAEKPKSNLRETIGGASKPDNFHTDAYKAALKRGDLPALDRAAGALHGSGHDFHYATGEWQKASDIKPDASRPWLIVGTKNEGKPSQARFIVRRPGHSPEAPRDAAAVEFNGQHLGHILPGDNGGLKISAGADMPEHTVRNFDQAIAGFHAVHVIKEKRRTDKIAEDKARSDRIIAQNEEYRRKAAEAVAAATKAKDAREARIARNKAEANRKRLAKVAKGEATRRKVTRDTPTMQGNREKIGVTLAAPALDIHAVNDTKNLKVGRAVKFKANNYEPLPQGPHTSHQYVNSTRQSFTLDGNLFYADHQGIVAPEGPRTFDSRTGKMTSSTNYADWIRADADGARKNFVRMPDGQIAYLHHDKNGGRKLVGSSEHTGHIVHIDSSTVHVATDTHTFTGNVYKGRVSGQLDRRNAAEDKAMVEGSRRPLSKGSFNTGAGAYKSGASTLKEHLAIADAEFRRRMELKAAKAVKGAKVKAAK